MRMKRPMPQAANTPARLVPPGKQMGALEVRPMPGGGMGGLRDNPAGMMPTAGSPLGPRPTPEQMATPTVDRPRPQTGLQGLGGPAGMSGPQQEPILSKTIPSLQKAAADAAATGRPTQYVGPPQGGVMGGPQGLGGMPDMGRQVAQVQPMQRQGGIPVGAEKKGMMKKGGSVKSSPAKTMASGGKVSSASKRADGCAIRGKTRA